MDLWSCTSPSPRLALHLEHLVAEKASIFDTSGGRSSRSGGGVEDPVAVKLDPVAPLRWRCNRPRPPACPPALPGAPPRCPWCWHEVVTSSSPCMDDGGALSAATATELCSASATTTVGSLKLFLLLPDELLLPHPATSRLLLNKEQRVCFGY
ncbi:hypothetical protein VPH35_135293 [Triticum aestivum]